jgi:hypothetical protein
VLVCNLASRTLGEKTKSKKMSHYRSDSESDYHSGSDSYDDISPRQNLPVPAEYQGRSRSQPGTYGRQRRARHSMGSMTSLSLGPVHGPRVIIPSNQVSPRPDDDATASHHASPRPDEPTAVLVNEARARRRSGYAPEAADGVEHSPSVSSGSEDSGQGESDVEPDYHSDNSADEFGRDQERHRMAEPEPFDALVEAEDRLVVCVRVRQFLDREREAAVKYNRAIRSVIEVPSENSIVATVRFTLCVFVFLCRYAGNTLGLTLPLPPPPRSFPIVSCRILWILPNGCLSTLIVATGLESDEICSMLIPRYVLMCMISSETKSCVFAIWL